MASHLLPVRLYIFFHHCFRFSCWIPSRKQQAPLPCKLCDRNPVSGRLKVETLAATCAEVARRCSVFLRQCTDFYQLPYYYGTERFITAITKTISWTIPYTCMLTVIFHGCVSFLTAIWVTIKNLLEKSVKERTLQVKADWWRLSLWLFELFPGYASEIKNQYFFFVFFASSS